MAKAKLDLDDAKAGGSRERAPGMGDLTAVFKFPEKKWVSLRLLPGLQPEAGYWIKTKKKDGKFTKFYTACPSFDYQAQERDSTKYDPWRDLEQQEAAASSGKQDRENALVQFGQHYWMNAIIRSEQKKQPSKLPKPTKEERSSGNKDKDSDSWTPVMVVKIGRSLANKLKELKGLNTVESKKTGAVKAYSVNDPKFGRDIRVYYDSTKAPADQYQVQLGDKRTPLSEEEEAYLTWDMSGIEQTFDKAEVKRDFESWASRNGVKLGKGKKAKDEDDDDSDDDGDDDFDDEDDEPKSKKSKKSKGKPAKKDEDEDEDDDDDEDSDDDDDDEDSDDDSDDDGDDDDSDDDSDDEDDSDDDSDDEDEDDEDEPKPSKKSKGKPAKASKGKPSKKSSDDDDDEDDLDDDDLDDDDEPKPSKKSKGKPAKPEKKAKGKPAKPAKKSKKDDDGWDD